MGEICNISGIEKRRSSAYHSQGNEFAERNIRSIRDMLRAVSLHRKMRQTQWRQLLPGPVFALNTSESKAIKCVPYNVVFGRNAVLPQDILFNHNVPYRLTDVTTPADFSAEVNFALRDIYNKVIENLQLSKAKMQQRYNTNIRFNDYKSGDNVWLKTKHYKSGESRRLSPRRNGLWQIMEKLPNRVNFRIINVRSRQQKIVHHDRLSPVRESELSTHDAPVSTMPPDPNVRPQQASDAVSEWDSDDSSASSDLEPDFKPDLELDIEGFDEPTEPRQYPRRIRTQRQLPGQNPWTSLDG